MPVLYMLQKLFYHSPFAQDKTEEKALMRVSCNSNSLGVWHVISPFLWTAVKSIDISETEARKLGMIIISKTIIHICLFSILSWKNESAPQRPPWPRSFLMLRYSWFSLHIFQESRKIFRYSFEDIVLFMRPAKK